MRKTTIYLAALLILVANDHVFKYAWPGAVTGKLSDFAGVFALAWCLARYVGQRSTGPIWSHS